jgi:hypothetical protein
LPCAHSSRVFVPFISASGAFSAAAIGGVSAGTVTGGKEVQPQHQT